MPTLLVIRKGRKWAGSVKLSGKSYIWRTRERGKGRTCDLGPLVEEDIHVLYICMVFYSLQNTNNITLQPHGVLGGQHIITIFQMKKLPPRNKWNIWSQRFLSRSNVLTFFLLHLGSFSEAGLHEMSFVNSNVFLNCSLSLSTSLSGYFAHGNSHSSCEYKKRGHKFWV